MGQAGNESQGNRLGIMRQELVGTVVKGRMQAVFKGGCSSQKLTTAQCECGPIIVRSDFREDRSLDFFFFF